MWFWISVAVVIHVASIHLLIRKGCWPAGFFGLQIIRNYIHLLISKGCWAAAIYEDRIPNFSMVFLRFVSKSGCRSGWLTLSWLKHTRECLRLDLARIFEVGPNLSQCDKQCRFGWKARRGPAPSCPWDTDPPVIGASAMKLQPPWGMASSLKQHSRRLSFTT